MSMVVKSGSNMTKWKKSWKDSSSKNLIIKRLKNKYRIRLIEMILIINILRKEEQMIYRNHLIVYYHHNSNNSHNNNNNRSNSHSQMVLIYRNQEVDQIDMMNTNHSSSRIISSRIMVTVYHLKKKIKCMNNVMDLLNVSTIVL